MRRNSCGILIILVLLTGCSNTKDYKNNELSRLIKEQQKEINYLSKEKKKLEIEIGLIEIENKHKDKIIKDLSSQLDNNIQYQTMVKNLKIELEGLYYTFNQLSSIIVANSKENYENYGLINKYNPHKIKIGDKVGNWVVDEFIEEETELREITFKGSVDLKGRFYFNRNIDGYLFDIEDDSDIPIPINHAYSYLCWIDNMEAVFEKYGKELNEENLYHFKVNKVVYSNGITLSAISLVIEEIMD